MAMFALSAGDLIALVMWPTSLPALKNLSPRAGRVGKSAAERILHRCFPIALRRGCQTTGCWYSGSMILDKFPEVQKLSPSEKLLFVSELWNDLEAHPSEVPVSREVLAELDRRMEHFRKHPDEFATWEAVKERILGARS